MKKIQHEDNYIRKEVLREKKRKGNEKGKKFFVNKLMQELCTSCFKLYIVVVNFISWDFGIGCIDYKVGKGRDGK